MKPQNTSQLHEKTLWLILLLAIPALLLVHHLFYNLGQFPAALNLGLREPIDYFQFWAIGNRTSHPMFLYFFEPFSATLDRSLRWLEGWLLWLPWPVLVTAVFLLSQKVADLRLALLTSSSVLLMGMMGLWPQSMQTLALMSVAVFFSLLVGLPLGILSARSDRFERAIRPLLDAMQTMPAFTYLIPVGLFFGVARVPSIVATMIYAIPPLIRLTGLGIRRVPTETIEAARAFGTTERQLLFKVQLPLAMPTIMAGVNQAIMMALSIVVIAAIIGAGGLGKVVLDGLRGVQVGLATEAGLAIVFMAILLDRLTGALTRSPLERRSYQGSFRLLPSAWRNWLPARIVEAALAQLYEWGGQLCQFVASLLARSVQWAAGWAAPRQKRVDWQNTAVSHIHQNAYLLTSLLSLGLLLWLSRTLNWLIFPAWLRLPLRRPVDQLVAWMRDNLFRFEVGGLTLGTGPIGEWIIVYGLNPLDHFLQIWLPWPALILIMMLLGLALGGWRLALLAGFCALSLGLFGMWQVSLVTLSQVFISVLMALLIALPLGILAGRSDTAAALLRPILDLLQTIPSFVFLVPVIMLFSVGRVPGIIAAVLYALPPAVRLTSLGIRQAEAAAVEAAVAFGSTSWQTLTKVQLPLALPTIMSGINQTTMMVLAMVVIAGMVGGAGLGLEAVNGLFRNQMGRGIEAGLAIVFLAILLDRLLQAWARRQEVG
jgi:glycine betaine/proline transport system permease protein